MNASNNQSKTTIVIKSVFLSILVIIVLSAVYTISHILLSLSFDLLSKLPVIGKLISVITHTVIFNMIYICAIVGLSFTAGKAILKNVGRSSEVKDLAGAISGITITVVSVILLIISGVELLIVGSGSYIDIFSNLLCAVGGFMLRTDEL